MLHQTDLYLFSPLAHHGRRRPPEHYVVYYQYSSGHPQMLGSFRSCEKAVDCLLEQQRQTTEGHALIGPPKTRKQLLEHLSAYSGILI